MVQEVLKVVCDVVHDGHLLVFTHDDVPMTVTGVQVPAGTINPGELPEHAAAKEFFEETGRRAQVIRPVGIQRFDMRPGRNEVAVWHYIALELPNADVSERWTAGESDSFSAGAGYSWTCWWLPLSDAHVLAVGFGGLLGSLLSNDAPRRAGQRALPVELSSPGSDHDFNPQHCGGLACSRGARSRAEREGVPHRSGNGS